MSQTDIKNMMTSMSDSKLQSCVNDLIDLGKNGSMPLDCTARTVINEMVETGLTQPGMAIVVGQTVILQEAARRWLEIINNKQSTTFLFR